MYTNKEELITVLTKTKVEPWRWLFLLTLRNEPPSPDVKLSFLTRNCYRFLVELFRISSVTTNYRSCIKVYWLQNDLRSTWKRRSRMLNLTASGIWLQKFATISTKMATKNCQKWSRSWSKNVTIIWSNDAW